MFHNAKICLITPLWDVLPSAKRPEGRAARGGPGNVCGLASHDSVARRGGLSFVTIIDYHLSSVTIIDYEEAQLSHVADCRAAWLFSL